MAELVQISLKIAVQNWIIVNSAYLDVAETLNSKNWRCIYSLSEMNKFRETIERFNAVSFPGNVTVSQRVIDLENLDLSDFRSNENEILQLLLSLEVINSETELYSIKNTLSDLRKFHYFGESVHRTSEFKQKVNLKNFAGIRVTHTVSTKENCTQTDVKFHQTDDEDDSQKNENDHTQTDEEDSKTDEDEYTQTDEEDCKTDEDDHTQTDDEDSETGENNRIQTNKDCKEMHESLPKNSAQFSNCPVAHEISQGHDEVIVQQQTELFPPIDALDLEATKIQEQFLKFRDKLKLLKNSCMGIMNRSTRYKNTALSPSSKCHDSEVHHEHRFDYEKLQQDMETLFLSGKGSDATLVLQNEEIPVHRAILRSRSSVFDAVFTHEMVETTSGVLTITDFDPGVFRDFLLYLYSGKVAEFSQENAIGMYLAADKYNTPELKPKCVEFLKSNLSVGIFCVALSLALQHKEFSLLDAAVNFFIKNLKGIILTNEWKVFLKENPIEANELLIKASHFYVPPEE